MLGHSSIKVTERYAHLAGTILEEAARATREPMKPNRARSEKRKRSGEKAGSHLRDLNSRPTVYESEVESSDIANLGGARAKSLALKGLELAATGDARAWALLVELAEVVVEAVVPRQRRVG